MLKKLIKCLAQGYKGSEMPHLDMISTVTKLQIQARWPLCFRTFDQWSPFQNHSSPSTVCEKSSYTTVSSVNITHQHGHCREGTEGTQAKQELQLKADVMKQSTNYSYDVPLGQDKGLRYLLLHSCTSNTFLEILPLYFSLAVWLYLSSLLAYDDNDRGLSRGQPSRVYSLSHNSVNAIIVFFLIRQTNICLSQWRNHMSTVTNPYW